MTVVRGNVMQCFNKENDVEFDSFKNQSYNELKKECLAKKILFKDPEFPAVNRSIFYSKDVPKGIVWKRPREIMKEPKFIVNTANANDLCQGDIGDCWFISACAAVAYRPELFHRVVPMEQTFDKGDYAGIFHFRFWLYGKWHDVVIDDRLPVYSNGELFFCRNKYEKNEFWPALIEKAYAKIYGCYENLDGGLLSDALVDLTGGIQEEYVFKKSISDRQEIWDILCQSRKAKSLNGASIESSNGEQFRLRNGLITNHIYTITKIAILKDSDGSEVRLIRLRNPWGDDGDEWNGRWSDDSDEWKQVDSKIKKDIGFCQREDGEFWMSFDDFYTNFDKMDFCSLTPDAFSDEALRTQINKTNFGWNAVSCHGEWQLGISAGGCGKDDRDKFWLNPQFIVTLSELDSEDNKCTMVVALLQKHTREKRSQVNKSRCEEHIQLRVYKIRNKEDAENARKNGVKLSFEDVDRVGSYDSYIDKREITKRYHLEPADYLIIPSCYDCVDAKFLLRVFTEKPIKEENAKILLKHNDNKKEAFSVFGTLKSMSILKPKISIIENPNEIKEEKYSIYAPLRRIPEISAHLLGCDPNQSKRFSTYENSKTSVKELCNVM